MIKLGGLGIVLTVAFLIWCVATSDPHERMERACKPVEKTGNVVVSITALLAETEWVGKTRNKMNDLDYGCQYIVWRLFYEQGWVEQQQQLREDAASPVRHESPEGVESDAGALIIK